MSRKNPVEIALLLGCMLMVGCGTGNLGHGSDGVVLTKDDVVRHIKQAGKDYDASISRANAMGCRTPTRICGAKFWYTMYPVYYARERLITRGSAVVPVLLEVIRDTEHPAYSDIAYFTWTSLNALDPRTYLEEVYRAGMENRLSPDQVADYASFIPFYKGRPADWNKEEVLEWLGRQLSEKTFDQIVLEELDVYIMIEDAAKGGMRGGYIDKNMLRWLNRIYDMDFDAYLEANAPDVLQFRREQMARGYDPVSIVQITGTLTGAMHDGMIHEALNAIYTSPEDRQAFEKLVRILHDGYEYDSPYRLRPPDGWRENLRVWYTTHRSSLRYDPSLLRFVVADEPAD